MIARDRAVRDAGGARSGHLDSRNSRQPIRLSEHRNQKRFPRQPVCVKRVPLTDAGEPFELAHAARLEKHAADVRQVARLGFREQALASDHHVAAGENSRIEHRSARKSEGLS